MPSGARLWFVSMIVCVGGSATAAHAHEIGFEAGLRAGYAIPFGQAVEGGADLDDAVAGQVPLILDLGVRVTPQVFIGVFGQYGFGITANPLSESCDVSDEISCDATDLRLGLEAHYHFQPGQQLDPWIGFGIGYEWLTLSVEGAGMALSSTVSGFEFFALQGGLDIALSEHFRVGPFLSFSVGEFATRSVDCSGISLCGALAAQGSTIDDKALHEWLMIGARAAFAP